MAELVSELHKESSEPDVPENRNLFGRTPIGYDGDAYAADAKVTDIREYDKVAARLSEPDVIQLFHCIIGKVTEVGELADALKKYVIYGKSIDWVNVVEELGDDQWYSALGALVTKRVLGVGFTDIQKLNVAKLKDRYGDKFTEEKALKRNLQRERQTLEGNSHKEKHDSESVGH